jgi:hypothetical protein
MDSDLTLSYKFVENDGEDFYSNIIKYILTQQAFSLKLKNPETNAMILKNINNMMNEAKECFNLEQQIKEIIGLLNSRQAEIKNISENMITSNTEQNILIVNNYVDQIHNLNTDILRYIQLVEIIIKE